MRLRGYALSELLVAVAIAGLIIGVLTFLNVDYVSLGRRVADIGRPYELGTRVGAGDPCATPGGVLIAGDRELVAHGPDGNAVVLTLDPVDPDRPDAGTQVGEAGFSTRPVRVVVRSAVQALADAGAPAKGVGPASMAAVEIGGATVAAVSPRCELRQVCSYDAANAMCQEDEAVAEPS
ncbi:MAG TPA: hypothetical protein VGF50_13070 [Caulobacteraceae bacterium]|jgi:hypothetical protein